MIVVPEAVIFGLMLALLITVLLFVVFYIDMKKTPGVLVLRKAYKKKLPVAFVHYPEGTMRAYIPKIEKHNPEVTTPYHIVEGAGIKFKNADGKKVERWDGKIPIYNYFVNIPEPVATADAVAFSQLKDHLKKKGIDIETIEDVAFYVLSEYEKSGNLDEALRSARIDDEETREKVLAFLKFVQQHRSELERLKLRSGLFTFQTAARALDATIAYTSSNVAHMKRVIEASLRRELQNPYTDFFKYGLFIFLSMLGLGALYIIVRG